jgi:hypothetical protein
LPKPWRSPTKTIDDCDESGFALVVSVARAKNGDRSVSSAAPATLSYVCFALRPAIPEVRISASEVPEMAASGPISEHRSYTRHRIA